MDSTILKVCDTGQITLPKKWRSKFKTDRFKAVMNGNKIILEPVEEYETFFDADEFNDGRGVEIGVFIRALEKSLE